MDVWLKVLTGLAAVAGGAWVWLLVGRGWYWRTDVQLPASSPDSASDQWPAVTAVIPARNEATVLPSTARSRLGSWWCRAVRAMT